MPVQARFLAAISQLNPAVLQSLKELTNAQPRLTKRRELKRWARQWNLPPEWVIDWVVHTIRWQREGPSRRWGRFFHPDWSLKSRFERRPATINEAIQSRIRGIDFGDWVGEPRTRSMARERALSAFRRILRESLEEVGATAIGSELFEPRRRRSRGRAEELFAPKRSTNEVFLWLAGYQTRGWSRGRIAEAVGVERNAVGAAIRKLATELKIGLRADRLYDKNQTFEKIRYQLERARSEEQAAEALLDDEIYVAKR